MSFQAKRELLAQTALQYRADGPRQKRAILDEFVTATGYARKYTIRLLGHPAIPRSVDQRRHGDRYAPTTCPNGLPRHSVRRPRRGPQRSSLDGMGATSLHNHTSPVLATSRLCSRCHEQPKSLIAVRRRKPRAQGS